MYPIVIDFDDLNNIIIYVKMYSSSCIDDVGSKSAQHILGLG